jgi:hypothetical protein
MKLIGMCVLMLGITAPLDAQTPQPPPTVPKSEVAARKSPVIVTRNERPTVMEALMRKDRHLRTLLNAFDVKEPTRK